MIEKIIEWNENYFLNDRHTDELIAVVDLFILLQSPWYNWKEAQV